MTEHYIDSASPVSNFTKVNPSIAAVDLTQGQTSMISSFIIGPQVSQPGPGQQTSQMPDFIDIFVPYVYITNAEGKLEKFKMFVYLGYKTMLVTLYKPDQEFSYKFIRQLQAYSNRQVVVLSQLLDQ